MNHLATFPIHRPLSGYSLQVPAFRLGSLLGGQQVEDDVINLRLELLYLQQSLSGGPLHFLLPIFFPHALLEAFNWPRPTYTPLLSCLRSTLKQVITKRQFGGLSFAYCSASHYTSYHLDTAGRLYWGNSLTGEPWSLAEIRDALVWFVDGLGIEVGSMTSMEMPPQDPWSHDCALFGFEGIRSRMEAGPPWTRLVDIDALRRSWLVDILIHSFHAEAFPVRSLHGS